ncbi:hypothetical protein O0L34_g1647 [Tuta absoluta]|nr:hypothetical protein O0L34_g1647 [Tuta absoluta]
MSEQLVLLSALCALEAAPLRFNHFPAFWRDVAAEPADSKLEEMLLGCSMVTEYVDAVLLDERESLEDPIIFSFMQHYYPKLSGGAAGAAGTLEALAEELCSISTRAPLNSLLGLVRALLILASRGRVPPAAARAMQRAATTIQQRLHQPQEEDTSEPETPREPPAEAPRCHTPEGSSGEEHPDEPTGSADESGDESSRARPPAPEPRAALTQAVTDLAAAAAAALAGQDT